MPQIIPARRDYIGESLREFNESGAPARFGKAFGYNKADNEKRAKQAKFEENYPEYKDLPPEFQKIKFEADLKRKQVGEDLVKGRSVVKAYEDTYDLPEGSLDAYQDDPHMARQVAKDLSNKLHPKDSKTPFGEKKVPEEYSNKIEEILNANPNATANQLTLKFDKAKIPPGYTNKYVENRRQEEEHLTKNKETRATEMRKETLPIRTELANKAAAAEKGIQNKQELLNLIEKGDINDPTFAALAEALPLNLGKRLLSNDTVEYKAGLVEEFQDLRNIFQGQTRIKEIELLENKIADIYLTDDQKKAVLKSRINALRADVIRAESAAELEDRDDLGVLQFRQEIEKRAKPKLDALFNQILDEQKSIIQDAENRKKIPLSMNDSDDKKIIQQIMSEAGNDWKKAEKLAKEKGYTW
jgi:hypothetical protein